MRKAFEILAFTLLELVIYILLLSGFYYLFCYTIVNNPETPSIHLMPTFFKCIVRFTPACAIFSLVLLIISFIRRNCSFMEMILPYAIVSILVWLFLVPGALYLDAGNAPGLADWIGIIPDDASIKEMFVLPPWTSYLLERFDLLHTQLVSSMNKGLWIIHTWKINTDYLFFFLSLAAIGCFARFSTWRLWNVFFVIFAFAVSVVLNSYLFDYQVMLLWGQKLNEFFSGFPVLKQDPEKWAKQLPMLANGIIFLLYTLFGVFSLIGAARRRRG